jgi:hypothetical protein
MDDGASAFEEIEVELTNEATIGSLSKPYPVTSIVFRETPPEYDFNWHPAPHRQYIVLLDGEIEIECGMSEKRRSREGIFSFWRTLGGRVIVPGRPMANFVDPFSAVSTPDP